MECQKECQNIFKKWCKTCPGGDHLRHNISYHTFCCILGNCSHLFSNRQTVYSWRQWIPETIGCNSYSWLLIPSCPISHQWPWTTIILAGSRMLLLAGFITFRRWAPWISPTAANYRSQPEITNPIVNINNHHSQPLTTGWPSTITGQTFTKDRA